MILTATPHPAADGRPPFIRIEVTAPEDATFASLKILRNGVPIRSQPPVAGLSTTYTDDYEAPFGVPVRYTAEAEYGGGWEKEFVENWDDLDDWDDADYWTVSNNRLVQTVYPPTSSEEASRGGIPIGSDRSFEIIMQPGNQRGDYPYPTVEYWSHLRLPGFYYFRFGGDWWPYIRVWGGPLKSVELAQQDEEPVVVTYIDGQPTASIVCGTEIVHIPVGTSTPADYNPRAYAAVYGDPDYPQLGGFSYKVDPGIGGRETDTVTVVLDEQWPWLIHPANPSLSVRIDEPCTWGQCGKTDHLHIDPSTAEEVQSEDRRALFVPYGRRESVVFPLGRRPMGTWDLVLNATGLEARNRVMAALTDQAPLLLRMPPRYAEMDLTDGWYSVGAAPVKRLTTDDLRNRRRLLTLEMTRTAIPPVPRVPEFTWGDAFSRGFVWGDLTDYTWFDLLKGEV